MKEQVLELLAEIISEATSQIEDGSYKLEKPVDIDLIDYATWKIRKLCNAIDDEKKKALKS